MPLLFQGTLWIAGPLQFPERIVEHPGRLYYPELPVHQLSTCCPRTFFIVDPVNPVPGSFCTRSVSVAPVSGRNRIFAAASHNSHPHQQPPNLRAGNHLVVYRAPFFLWLWLARGPGELTVEIRL